MILNLLVSQYFLFLKKMTLLYSTRVYSYVSFFVDSPSEDPSYRRTNLFFEMLTICRASG